MEIVFWNSSEHDVHVLIEIGDLNPVPETFEWIWPELAV